MPDFRRWILVLFLVSLASDIYTMESTEEPPLTLNEASTEEPAITLNENDHPELKETHFELLEDDFENLNPTEANNGQELFEGDILLTPEQKRRILHERKAVASLSKRWPNGDNGFPLVPYLFEDDVNQTAVKAAIVHWETHTCIRFQSITAGEANSYHLRFFIGNGCWSFVGMVDSSGQQVSIAPGCTKLGTVVHEIGHAIGFYHEHSRSDRDDHIHVNFDNVKSDKVGNFQKRPDNNYSVPYDLTSDMHYNSKGFTANGYVTIATLNPLAQELIGQRTGLSHYDKLLANTMYPCITKWLEKCSLSSNPCQNDGYIGSDCACVCRSGTSGNHCDNVEKGYYDSLLLPGCSENITAEGSVTSPNYPDNYPKGLKCVKWIQAPECHTAEIKFNAFHIHNRTGICSTGTECCIRDLLEIRTNDLFNGTIYCGTEITPGKIFSSPTNQLILYFESRKDIYSGWSADVIFKPVPGCVSAAKCNEEKINDRSSQWTSPNFGIGDYPNDASCTMTSSSTEPSWASIKFNKFQLQELNSNGDCPDLVNFTTPNDLDKPSFCGKRTSEVVRLPSYNFLATFESDGSGTDAGFNITVTKKKSKCHKLISATYIGEKGIIRAPRSANYVWEKKACEWWIRSPPDTKIQLEFLFMKLTRNCTKSSVIVNRGGDNSYPASSSERYCGTDNPTTMISDENEMNVFFFSKRQYKRFKAEWTVVGA